MEDLFLFLKRDLLIIEESYWELRITGSRNLYPHDTVTKVPLMLVIMLTSTLSCYGETR